MSNGHREPNGEKNDAARRIANAIFLRVEAAIAQHANRERVEAHAIRSHLVDRLSELLRRKQQADSRSG